MADAVTDSVVPHEHKRYARYLQQFASAEDDLTLVTTVLADPDQVMGTSAIGEHIDRKAAELLESPDFPGWAKQLGDLVTDRPFLVKRLAEWGLLRALALSEPVRPEELLEASNWLQQKAISDGTAELLAEHGRTKSVRGQAAHHLRTRKR